VDVENRQRVVAGVLPEPPRKTEKTGIMMKPESVNPIKVSDPIVFGPAFAL
jgi:hypothetical protein